MKERRCKVGSMNMKPSCLKKSTPGGLQAHEAYVSWDKTSGKVVSEDKRHPNEQKNKREASDPLYKADVLGFDSPRMLSILMVPKGVQLGRTYFPNV